MKISAIPGLRVLLLILSLAVILFYGQALFVPLSFAFFIAFVLYPICKWLEARKLHRTLAILLSLFPFFFILLAVLALLARQFSLLVKQWPVLYTKVLPLLDQLLQKTDLLLGFSLEDRQEWLRSILASSAERLLQWLPGTLYSTSISFGFLLLIPIYVAGLLYYRDVLLHFLYSISSPSWKLSLRKLLPEIIHTYYNFVKGMALVYLFVGLLNSIGLLFLGIPNPFLFGFIASILTFIPYVGIIIGALLPMLVAWLTFNSIWYPLGVTAVFALVQILEANLIYPLAVSYKLKINALATLLVMVGGGILWGLSGMILFPPFLAIFKLLAEKVDMLRPLGILLSTHSELQSFAQLTSQLPSEKEGTHELLPTKPANFST